MILDIRHARTSRAVGTAVESIVGLDAVSDDLAPTVVADRGQFVNRALKTVERVTHASRRDLECQVIIVAAHFTFRHYQTPFNCTRAVHRPGFAFLTISTTA